jgi:hypothetical protein
MLYSQQLLLLPCDMGSEINEIRRRAEIYDKSN